MNKNEPLTVSETNDLVKTIISSYLGNKIHIKGELSNKKNSSGNLYFSLKDNYSTINCVFWKCPNDIFQNGDIITANGKLTCYTKNGTYQLLVYNMEKSGNGDINYKYDELKKDFEQKGYFGNNKDFPVSFKNIGILTSLEGAALQDILYVLNNNNFYGNVYLKNCLVQGVNSPNSIKCGIDSFIEMNKKIPIDILLITRGGGSIEDLMAYSHEDVVKSLYKCQIFTISAVGHEIDNMLSDFAANYRAPTPSIAAETLIKYQKKNHETLIKNCNMIERLEDHIISQLSIYESNIEQLKQINQINNPINIISNKISMLENIKNKLQDKIYSNIKNIHHDLDKLKMENNTHDIQKLLKHGYSVIVDDQDNIINSSEVFAKKMKDNKNIKIIFEHGEVNLNDM